MVEPLKNSIVSSERKKGLSDGLKINSGDSIRQDNKAEGCGIESGIWFAEKRCCSVASNSSGPCLTTIMKLLFSCSYPQKFAR